jgi:hypothetical protein
MATAEEDCGWSVSCNLGQAAGDAIGGAAGAVVQDAATNLAEQVVVAFGKLVGSLGTLWVNVGTPNLTNTGGASSVDGASAPGIRELTTVLGYVTWVSLAVAIIALTLLGALIATRIRTGEGIASLGRVGLILGGVALVGGAGSIVSALLPNGPVGVSGTVAFLQSSLWPYMLIATALSVVVGGARMFWESRAEPGRDLLRSLLTLAVVGGAGVTVVALLVTAADRFSVWVINNSLTCDVTADNGACFGDSIGELMGLSTLAGPGMGPVLIIIFGLIAILASVVQIVLMVARSGMLVILAGILPLAASFTNTEMGRSWFKKCIGWLVAFILYKPAAAVVYAAAFQLTGTDLFADDGSGVLAVVTGLMLMVLALFAMPALMRFVTPMVSSLAAGGGGAAVAAGTMAAIPTGAAAVGRLATGAGGGGAATASNAAPQSPSHNTNTSTTSTTATSPSGAGQGGSKGSTPAPTGAPSAGGVQAASAGGGASAGGSAAAGGAAATGAGAAAAGPAGAAVAAGLQAGQAASSAAKNTAEQVTGDGPSGSH